MQSKFGLHLRLLLGHSRRDAAGREQSARPIVDRLSHRHMGQLQFVHAGAPVEFRLSRAVRAHDALQRRLHHRAARRNVGNARHTHLLPGAAGERELHPHCDPVILAHPARPVDRLSTLAGSFRLRLSRIHTARGHGSAHQSHHRRHHHSRWNAGAKRSRARADSANLPNLGRHPRQARLERAACTDGYPMVARAGRDVRLSRRYGNRPQPR